MKKLQWVLGVAGVTALAGLVAGSAGAAPPSGSYMVSVSGSQEIFLPSGSIHQGGSSGSIDLSINVDFAANEIGLFGGSGSIGVSGLANGTLAVTPGGKVTGTTAKPIANVALKFAGDIEAVGYPGKGHGTIHLACKRPGVDPTVMSCKGRVRVCGSVPGLGSACAGAPIDTVIGAQGGPWTLTLFDLATDPKGAVTGGAEVALATGQLLDFEVTGKYNAKSDLSNLKFRGIGTAAAAQLSLGKFSPAASAGLLKFKLGGQRGSVDLSTLP